MNQCEETSKCHTFEEFLAGIFLEECFMSNRTMQVIDHQVKHWKNLLFCIASIVRESCILTMSAPLFDCYVRPCLFTHGPRSKIKRAKYIAAAATRLCP